MTNLNWQELSYSDFEELQTEKYLAILPLGSTEQHGPHLPVATDALIVEAVIKGIKEQLDDINSIYLPTLWCTKSSEHIDFPGTILLSTETFLYVLNDISASVERAGFKKIVFINSHGGNSDILAMSARDIRLKTGLMTFVVDIMRLLPAFSPKFMEPGKFDIHAGEFETSVIMHYYPKLMDGKKVEAYGSDLDRGKVASSFNGYKFLRPEQGSAVTVGWKTNDYSDDGVIGNPKNANAKNGELGLKALVHLVSQILREIYTFDYKD